MESMVLSRLEHDLHMVIFRYVSFLDDIEIISTFWGVKIHLPVLEGSVPAVEIQGAKAPRPGKTVFCWLTPQWRYRLWTFGVGEALVIPMIRWGLRGPTHQSLLEYHYRGFPQSTHCCQEDPRRFWPPHVLEILRLNIFLNPYVGMAEKCL